MFDISAIGELLIDFTPNGLSTKQNQLFECNPGGAPANVLSAATKLGLKTAFIGKVGNDQFGNLLKRTLDNAEIDSKGLIMSEEYNTTLAFVHLKDDGDRSFSFYRNPGADMMLNENEVEYDIIKNSKIFHFGSVSMTNEPSRTATIEAVKYAKNHCKIVSYDPNLRELLWNNLEEAKHVMLSCMQYCDILKISEEELEFLTGTVNLESGSQKLYNEFGIKMIFVTLGEKGCFYKLNKLTGRGHAYHVKTIDTTGAGDSFVGAVLYQLLRNEKSLDEYSSEEISYIIDFAAATSALVTTQYGGIMAMPCIEDVYTCMQEAKKRSIDSLHSDNI